MFDLRSFIFRYNVHILQINSRAGPCHSDNNKKRNRVRGIKMALNASNDRVNDQYLFIVRILFLLYVYVF